MPIYAFEDKIPNVSPEAARAAGSALAGNPFPLIIPCHRVIKADGFAGQFGSGTEVKKSLLRMEGVEIDDRGKINTDFFYQTL
ncbi:MAG: MGMT family protein [Thermodesulfobacteriota bacterium]|nr:MGMT family protein [Thermodesulfobacteriota bacterium]